MADRGESLRILLVEDNHSLRRLLGMIFRFDGHQVTEVADSIEGLRAIASAIVEDRRTFDVIVCEHSQREVSGLTVLAALRTRDRSTPFVLITGDPRIQGEALRLGAVILDHPFNVRAVRDAICQSPWVPAPTD
jgi:CheY-like chemotaxis protein